MVEWVVSESGLRAPDGERTLALDAPEWHAEPAYENSLPTDTTITGSALGLSISTPVTLSTAAGRHIHTDRSTPTDLPSGEYDLSFPVLRSDGTTRSEDRDASAYTSGERSIVRERPRSEVEMRGEKTHVRFAGSARIEEGDGELSVSFPGRTPIVIEFRRNRPATEPIVVPETPAGVATALTHLSSALRTAGPDRSHPAFRGHPPLVEFDDRVEIPESVRATTPDTGLRLSMPASIEGLLVAAPLAYYLGATVEVGDREKPVLSGPGGFERRFGPMPAFQHDVAAMLRRVFLLDCLTRAIDPAEVTPAGGSALDRLDLRRDGLVETTPAERLGRYCEVPSARLRPELPEWHLSTYVEPTVGNAQSLPYLLDDLSLVYSPSASELDGKGLLRQSLDDFYRTGDVATIDRLEPELHAGRAHGWLAPGTPIDVFKTTHSAYEHRLTYDANDDSNGESADSDSPLDVAVVFNDREMGGEHDRVAEIYRERAADLPANVTVETDLTRTELAGVFEAPNDFVHFIGHCDTDGLCCSDGGLSTTSLDTSRTRTFFLNACGSYHEGLGLVEAGSVAGAVTLTAVLNDLAATVGTAFARLLIHGFDIERAIQLARRRIMMGKDYAVVGDGTHTLATGGHGPPAVTWLERRDETFRLTYEVVETGTTGGTYRPPCGEDDRAYPRGVNADIELARAELLTLLESASIPVIYDGDLHWSTDLARRLDT
jgi:hypothetical protein